MKQSFTTLPYAFANNFASQNLVRLVEIYYYFLGCYVFTLCFLDIFVEQFIELREQVDIYLLAHILFR